jgi:hypothetical protein
MGMGELSAVKAARVRLRYGGDLCCAAAPVPVLPPNVVTVHTALAITEVGPGQATAEWETGGDNLGRSLKKLSVRYRTT